MAFILVALLRALFDAYGHVSAFLDFLPRPVARFITSPNGTIFLVVAGFALLWWAIRHPVEAVAPRIEIGHRSAYERTGDGELEVCDYLIFRNLGAAPATHITVDQFQIVDRNVNVLDTIATLTPADNERELRAYGLYDALFEPWVNMNSYPSDVPIPEPYQSTPIRLKLRIRYKVDGQAQALDYLLTCHELQSYEISAVKPSETIAWTSNDEMAYCLADGGAYV